MSLYVVATPIGNLGDMSPRAIDTLRAVDLILAEDTRVTMKLMTHFDIRTRIESLHQHNEAQKAEGLAKRLLEPDFSAALVSDAGMPAVSDPGALLVRACRDLGVTVLSVPGPSAALAALSLSGFTNPAFTFYGFPPRQDKACRDFLAGLAGRAESAILYESPHRVQKLMGHVAACYPKALCCLCCDLTKRFELSLWGEAETVSETLSQNPKADKGEYCLVIDLSGTEAPPVSQEDISLEARLLELMLHKALPLSEARRLLVDKGHKKNAVYQAALTVKRFLNSAQDENDPDDQG